VNGSLVVAGGGNGSVWAGRARTRLLLLFFFTLVTGPRRSLSLKYSVQRDHAVERFVATQ